MTVVTNAENVTEPKQRGCGSEEGGRKGREREGRQGERRIPSLWIPWGQDDFAHIFSPSRPSPSRIGSRIAPSALPLEDARDDGREIYASRTFIVFACSNDIRTGAYTTVPPSTLFSLFLKDRGCDTIRTRFDDVRECDRDRRDDEDELEDVDSRAICWYS